MKEKYMHNINNKRLLKVLWGQQKKKKKKKEQCPWLPAETAHS